MSAKSELFDRIKYIGYAVSQSSLIDVGIAQSEHNGAANLLRKGIGIVAFNVLEDFIKHKTVESLEQIANSGIEFSKLPDKLQTASTLGALNALHFRAKIVKKEGGDWKTIIQDEAYKIHSTQNNSYQFSIYSLLSSTSNVAVEDVPELLKAFGISGGWGLLKTVSDSIGGGVPDLQMSYRNAADRRHNSAHTASFQYLYGWLTQIKREIISIAASLDVLLMGRCRQIDRDLLSDVSSHNINVDLNYRFLEEDNGSYRETREIGGRARKIWANYADAITSLRPDLVANKEFLITLDASKSIVDWNY